MKGIINSVDVNPPSNPVCLHAGYATVTNDAPITLSQSISNAKVVAIQKGGDRSYSPIVLTGPFSDNVNNTTMYSGIANDGRIYIDYLTLYFSEEGKKLHVVSDVFLTYQSNGTFSRNSQKSSGLGYVYAFF